MLQQNSPTDSPGSLRGSALLPLTQCEGVKPQLPAPLPCSGGFIERDLLLKPTPQSPSVWSSLPETGISFTAPSPWQSCHCEIELVVPGAAPWRGWSSPLASRQGWVYFKVMGALCKQSPSARQTPHPAPKSGGFVKPRLGWAVNCCGFAHLLSASLEAQLRVGQGLQFGDGVLGMSALMHRAGAAPSISRVAMALLLGQDAPVVAGERKSSREVIFILSHLRGLARNGLGQLALTAQPTPIPWSPGSS